MVRGVRVLVLYGLYDRANDRHEFGTQIVGFSLRRRAHLECDAREDYRPGLSILDESGAAQRRFERISQSECIQIG